MMSYESLKDDFRFLVIEVAGQVKLTGQLLRTCEQDRLDKIASKDDYIDNLKSVVEKKAFSGLTQEDLAAPERRNALRAIHIMTVNLERIGDFCVNVARQTGYLTDDTIIHDLGYREMIDTIESALSMVMPVFEDRDLSGALSICRAEYHLDKMYKERFDAIMSSLRRGKDIEDLVTALFIFRYLERIGDSLLNIGEALLFAIKGEKLKIEQYEALQETLSNSQMQASVPDVEVTSILGSRSGCRISRIQTPHGDQIQGIFKEGNKKKIRLEHENMRRWESIQAGLVPKVLGYQENNGSASIIVEFISGRTLDDMLLNSGDDALFGCLKSLKETIHRVWHATARPGSFQTDYMRQMGVRLERVRQVHPTYDRQEKHVGDLDIPSSVQLMTACEAIEAEVQSPCHVFIHGDFNANNVFYEMGSQAIRYIDLYRSRFADYVQDASVFLISNYRLPFFGDRVRKRLNGVIHEFFGFFTDFAREMDDRAFEARMALALVRSFYTSTRFELNPSFSKQMFLSAHFLMESLVAHEGPWEAFTLPRKVLYC